MSGVSVTPRTGSSEGETQTPGVPALGPEQARVIEQEVETVVRGHERIADCTVVYQGAPDRTDACERCGMAAAYPGADLDQDGVCSFCRLYAEHGIEIHDYFGEVKDFQHLVKERSRHSPSAYDCLLLFSGGKDSTYVLHQLVALGLRVMTFTFDNGFISRTALRNVETTTTALGIEHVTATRENQNAIFLESLRQHQSVCNGCFRSLLDLSTRLAAERGIPTIVTGLSRGQIIDERLSWFHRRGIFDSQEIDRQLAVGRKVYHQIGERLDTSSVDAVEVVDYYRYSDITKDGIRAFLQKQQAAWEQPQDTGFCSSNCLINDVGVYVHSAERGFHNYESPTRWEVRLGHLARTEADEELRAPVNVGRVKRMLARIGYPDPAGAGRGRLGHRLTVYYVPREGADESELRTFAARGLPDFLFPEHWVRLDRVPRAAGAVQRSALPSVAVDHSTSGSSRSMADEFLAASESAKGLKQLVPLTAAQRLLPAPGVRADQGRALLVTLPGRPALGRVRKAVMRLMLRHDALRLRFNSTSAGEWRQHAAGMGGPVSVHGVDLSGRSPGEQRDRLAAAARRLIGGLDPESGPVARFARVEYDQDAPVQLLIVLHELVADARSWRILLRDLARVWEGLDTNLELPPAGSFLDLATAADWAADGDTGGSPERQPTPVTGTPADGTEVTWLDAADTWYVPAGRAPGAQVGRETPPAVLSALATALGSAFPRHAVTADLVDHSWHPDGPAAKVVGPLATVHTVHLPGDGSAVQPDGPVTIRLQYFGEESPMTEPTMPFTPLPLDAPGPTAPPRVPLLRLDVGATVRDGRLRLLWQGTGPFPEHSTLAALAHEITARLQRLVPAQREQWRD